MPFMIIPIKFNNDRFKQVPENIEEIGKSRSTDSKLNLSSFDHSITPASIVPDVCHTIKWGLENTCSF